MGVRNPIYSHTGDPEKGHRKPRGEGSGVGSTRPPQTERERQGRHGTTGGSSPYLRSEDGEATFHQRGFETGQFKVGRGAVSGSAVVVTAVPAAMQAFGVGLLVEVDDESERARTKKAGMQKNPGRFLSWHPTPTFRRPIGGVAIGQDPGRKAGGGGARC